MPMKTDSPYEDLDFSRELRIWAKKNNVTPTRLHKATGWNYQYCSGLLRGVNKFGYKSFGMIVCAFGLEAIQDIFRMANFKPGGSHEADQ